MGWKPFKELGAALKKGVKHVGGQLKKHGPTLLSLGAGLTGMGGLLGKVLGGGKGMGFLGDLAGKVGGMFGLGAGAPAQSGGMGGLLSLLGAGGMAQGGNYSASMMRNLQRQLKPLQGMHAKFGELGDAYMDPNSAMNQQMRNQIRTQNMEGFADISDRQRNMATGVFTPQSTGAMDSNMMSDAISKALGAHSQGMEGRMKQGLGLYQQQGNLANALSQAQTQNMFAAQQQSQFLPQYMSQTGMGLLNRALYPGQGGGQGGGTSG